MSKRTLLSVVCAALAAACGSPASTAPGGANAVSPTDNVTPRVRASGADPAPTSFDAKLAPSGCMLNASADGSAYFLFHPDPSTTLTWQISPGSDRTSKLRGELLLDGASVALVEGAIVDGTSDLTQVYQGVAAPKPVVAHVHATKDGAVTGDIDGHKLVAFNRNQVGADFVPKLADGAALPTIDPRVQAVLVKTLTAFSNQSGQCKPSSAVVYQSLPGGPGSFADSCGACHDSCNITFAGCAAGFAVGCTAALAIPIIGAAVYAVCSLGGVIICQVARGGCLNDCETPGHGCCPVACGNACCGGRESCLDAQAGLCCPVGFSACPGPNGVCYDPHTEHCRVDGSTCAVADLCGNDCCGDAQTCVTGNQCCAAENVCGGACCGAGQFCADPNRSLCVNIVSCAVGQTICTGLGGQICCGAGTNCVLSAGHPACIPPIHWP